MKQSQRRPSIFLNLILFAGLVVIWIAFAPTKVGGQASYVMVNGISMEPNYHTGDLVIVHKVQTYQVGDVVTYRDAILGEHIIHRIIAIEQDKYVFKGDNNSWIDVYRPIQEEIVGKQWIYIPKLGKVFTWMRSPLNLALIIGLLGGVLMVNMVLSPKNKNKRKKASTNLSPNSSMAIALYMLGLLFFAFLALSLYAFSRPVLITSNNILYQQDGHFSYSATGTPGIYDSNTVQPGEPIFPNLTCTLNVGFSYNLTGNQIQGITGSHQFYARVLDGQSGWSRTIPMSQVLAFNRTSFFNTSTLDLCQVEALVATLEQETGLRSSTYTMEVVSAVTIMGNVMGEIVSDSFAPVLTFKFDQTHFYLDSHNTNEDIFTASKPTMSSATTSQANILPLFGLKPTVQTARIAAIVGVILSLIGLLILGLYAYFAVQQDQEALIRLKYGSLLVDVYEGAYETALPIIDVTSIDNLAKLAERHSTVILHITRDFLQDYLVQGSNATYRYSAGAGENRIALQTSVLSETHQVVLNTNQSPYSDSRQPNQDPGYWGAGQSYYELEDTQPTIATQRSNRASLYRDDLVYNELDQTMFLGKIKY
ncbi:MAG: signal peptidase I [Anaerolineales bacterium]